MATTILEIIRLSLEITLQVIKDMPPEAKAKAWERHEKAMQFWEDAFKKLSGAEFRAQATSTRQ